MTENKAQTSGCERSCGTLDKKRVWGLWPWPNFTLVQLAGIRHGTPFNSRSTWQRCSAQILQTLNSSGNIPAESDKVRWELQAVLSLQKPNYLFPTHKDLRITHLASPFCLLQGPSSCTRRWPGWSWPLASLAETKGRKSLELGCFPGRQQFLLLPSAAGPSTPHQQCNPQTKRAFPRKHTSQVSGICTTLITSI